MPGDGAGLDDGPELFEELSCAQVCRAAEREDEDLAAELELGAKGINGRFPSGIVGQQVHLVQADDLLTLGEDRRVLVQLIADDAVVVGRVGAILRDGIEEVDEDFCPFDVTEEVKPEARAVGRAFDQARDIGDDEAASGVDFGNAELRGKRGEGV